MSRYLDFFVSTYVPSLAHAGIGVVMRVGDDCGVPQFSRRLAFAVKGNFRSASEVSLLGLVLVLRGDREAGSTIAISDDRAASEIADGNLASLGENPVCPALLEELQAFRDERELTTVFSPFRSSRSGQIAYGLARTAIDRCESKNFDDLLRQGADTRWRAPD